MADTSDKVIVGIRIRVVVGGKTFWVISEEITDNVSLVTQAARATEWDSMGAATDDINKMIGNWATTAHLSRGFHTSNWLHPDWHPKACPVFMEADDL